MSENKPFIDEKPSGPRPSSLSHLPKTCWTRRETGRPLAMRGVTGSVIHKISGRYKFPQDPLNVLRIDDEILIPYRLSYPFMIHPDGTTVLRVPENYQAWHAGLSRFNGRDYCNSFMTGVALVSIGKDTKHGPGFTTEQFEACVDLHVYLINRYGFDTRNITSHENVRAVWNGHHPENPGDTRSGDPGDFPWSAFREALKERLNGTI